MAAKRLIFVCCLFGNICSYSATGNEFVFSFLKCRDYQFKGTLTVAISNDHDSATATATLQNVDGDMLNFTDIQIEPKTVRKLVLPGKFQVQRGEWFGRPNSVVGFSTEEAKGFRLISDLPVQLYLDCQGGNTSIYQEDSTAVLPTTMLGRHYFAVALNIPAWWPRQLVVTTAHPDTNVSIRVAGFEPREFHFEKPLSTFAFSTMDDHSGTEIAATKPVAFASGEIDAVPLQMNEGANHAGEMMLPTNLWGRVFPLNPLYQSSNAMIDYRIVAANDDTEVVWQNRVVCRLNKGQNCLLRCGQGILHSSKPSLVVMFGEPIYSDDLTQIPIGTVFMSQVSAIKHFVRDTIIQYTTFGKDVDDRNQKAVRHFVQIIVNVTSCRNQDSTSLSLDGAQIDRKYCTAYQEVSGLIACLLETSNGTHTILNTNQCLTTVTVYGYARKYSYSYNAILGRHLAGIAHEPMFPNQKSLELLNGTVNSDTKNDCRDANLDMIIAVDSGHLDNDWIKNYYRVVDFALNFTTHMLKVQNTYSDQTQVGFSMMKQRSLVRRFLDTVVERDIAPLKRMLTNQDILGPKVDALSGVGNALTQFYEPTNRGDAPDVLMVMLTQTDESRPRSLATQAIGAGRHIIVIGMGNSTSNLDHLSQIGYSNPNISRRVIVHEGFDNLNKLIEPLCKGLAPLTTSQFTLLQSPANNSAFFLSAVFSLSETSLMLELVRFWISVTDESPRPRDPNKQQQPILLGWTVSQTPIHYRSHQRMQVDFYEFCDAANPPLPGSREFHRPPCQWTALQLPAFRTLRFKLHLGFNDALSNFDKYPILGGELTVETEQSAPARPELMGLQLSGEVVILTWRVVPCNSNVTALKILLSQDGDRQFTFENTFDEAFDCRLSPIHVANFKTDQLNSGENYTVEIVVETPFGASNRSEPEELRMPDAPPFPWLIVGLVSAGILLLSIAAAVVYSYKVKKRKEAELNIKEEELTDERLQKDIFRELYKGVARVTNYIGRPQPNIPVCKVDAASYADNLTVAPSTSSGRTQSTDVYSVYPISGDYKWDVDPNDEMKQTTSVNEDEEQEEQPGKHYVLEEEYGDPVTV